MKVFTIQFTEDELTELENELDKKDEVINKHLT